jgi:hypothetical protein
MAFPASVCEPMALAPSASAPELNGAGSRPADRARRIAPGGSRPADRARRNYRRSFVPTPGGSQARRHGRHGVPALARARSCACACVRARACGAHVRASARALARTHVRSRAGPARKRSRRAKRLIGLFAPGAPEFETQVFSSKVFCLIGPNTLGPRRAESWKSQSPANRISRTRHLTDSAANAIPPPEDQSAKHLDPLAI